ncbi:MAG: hypothetical protein ACKVVP_07150, partial [Chloroflexota bacterium]
VGRNSAWQQYGIATCATHRWANPDDPKDDGGTYYLAYDKETSRPIVKPGRLTPPLTQYFRYIRAGAIRVDALSDHGSFDPLAFVNVDGRHVMVIKAIQAGSVNVRDMPAGSYGVRAVLKGGEARDFPGVNLTEGEVIDVNVPGPGVVTIYGLP